MDASKENAQQQPRVLPEAGLQRIFSKLQAEELPPLRPTCKSWCEAINCRVAAISASIRVAADFPLKTAEQSELQGLSKFRSLRQLELWYTPASILQSLPPMPTLKKLSLGYCEFPPNLTIYSRDEAREWQLAQEFLASSQELSELSFSIPVCAGFKGCDALAALPALKKLSVVCEFGDPLYIMQGLSCLTGLKSFSLSYNRRNSYDSSIIHKQAPFPWMKSLRSLKIKLTISLKPDAIGWNARFIAAMLRSCGCTLKSYEVVHPPVAFLGDSAAVHEKLTQLHFLSVNLCNMDDLLGIPGCLSANTAWQSIGRSLRSYTPHAESALEHLWQHRPAHLTALHALGGFEEGEWDVLRGLTGLKELTVKLDDRCPLRSFPLMPLTNLTKLEWVVSPTATKTMEQRIMAVALQSLPKLKQLSIKISSYSQNSKEPRTVQRLGEIIAPAVSIRGLTVAVKVHIGGAVAPLGCLKDLAFAVQRIAIYQHHLQFPQALFEQLAEFSQLRGLELCGGWESRRQFAESIGRLSSLSQLSYLRMMDHLRGPGRLCTQLSAEELQEGCSKLAGLRKLCYHTAVDAAAPDFRACCQMGNEAWLPHEI